MPYAAEHLLFRVNGHFGSTGSDKIDFWSASMRFTIGQGTQSEAAKQAFLNNVTGVVQAFHTSSAVQATGSSYVDTLTAAYIDITGHYVGGDTQPTTEKVMPTTTQGAGATNVPYSFARVYSLRSDIDRGRGHIGRFYWPCSQLTDSTGRWTVQQCTDAALAAKSLIDDLNTAARGQWQAASSVSVFSKLGLGTIGTVTAVGVGRAPDTQRRRDNKVKEDHYYADLSTTAAARDAIAARQYDQGDGASYWDSTLG